MEMVNAGPAARQRACPPISSVPGLPPSPDPTVPRGQSGALPGWAQPTSLRSAQLNLVLKDCWKT